MKKNNVVEEIKAIANIVDVVGDVVSLKKKGANYQGLCPFHSEKTPSFVVSEGKQIFTCFGCHASGDVIEFVKKYKNLTFIEAVEDLAKRYGIEFENSWQNDKSKEKLYEINREAAIFFYKSILKGNNRGLSYIAQRGIDADTIYKFGIGYADDAWDSLYNHLKGKGYDEKDMTDLGLVSFSKGKYYDKFRNRLIFPIRDVKNRVIAFGGRAIGDDMPKYLNSPENSVFSKKNNLYGLNLSKEHITKNDKVILVEGYMDVVSLYQRGIKNAAASLGTALTENQGKLIKRYTKNVILSYDSDNAGINAAIRGGGILKENNLNVKVLNVDAGKDPDEYVKQMGKEAYLSLVDKAMAYDDYRLFKLSEPYDLTKPTHKIAFSKEIIKFLNSLSPVERDIYISVVSEKFSFTKEALRQETVHEDTMENKKNIHQQNSKEDIDYQLEPVEKFTIRIILSDTYFLETAIEKEVEFVTPIGKEIYSSILSLYKETGKVELSKLYENISQVHVETIENLIEDLELPSALENEFHGLTDKLKKKNLENESREIMKMMEIASEEGRHDEIKRLSDRYKNIQLKLKLGGKT